MSVTPPSIQWRMWWAWHQDGGRSQPGKLQPLSPRHTRNVEKNPAVTLTLESGSEVVIIEGESHATRAEPDDLGARLTQAFGKYADAGYAPEPDAWVGQDGGGLRIITPRRAMAWFDFPTDCTRFTF